MGEEESSTPSSDDFESGDLSPYSFAVWSEGYCGIVWATSVVLDEYALETLGPPLIVV